MKIQIICTSPGIRRNGKAHPASAFYDEGDWTETEMKRFESDPAFTVRVVDDAAENVKTDTDFALAVDAEVTRQVEAKTLELQASFNTAVTDAVAEKTAELKGEHDNAIDAIGKKLQTAESKISELETQLEAAKKPAAKTTK